jgi:hypothetical protein
MRVLNQWLFSGFGIGPGTGRYVGGSRRQMPVHPAATDNISAVKPSSGCS